MLNIKDTRTHDHELSGFDLEVDVSYPAGNGEVHLVDGGLIRDADYVRDGVDLVLRGENGSVTIEGYFSSPEAPLITGDNLTLTPDTPLLARLNSSNRIVGCNP